MARQPMRAEARERLNRHQVGCRCSSWTIREQGEVHRPYTGTCFASTRQTDIEHNLAGSEGQDSGLCAADTATRARFSRGPRDITLALPRVNRYKKSGKDLAEWVPDRKRCWFAGRGVEVRVAYGPAIDRREAAALKRILSRCESTRLEAIGCSVTTSSGAGTASAPSGRDNTFALCEDNGNGRTTCVEVHRHGIVPVARSHPAYWYMRDGEGGRVRVVNRGHFCRCRVVKGGSPFVSSGSIVSLAPRQTTRSSRWSKARFCSF